MNKHTYVYMYFLNLHDIPLAITVLAYKWEESSMYE